MKAKLMNGTYYEITGGISDNYIRKVSESNYTDKEVIYEAANTERVVYKNTYEKGKLISSIKLHDPYGDAFYLVGDERTYYEPLPKEMTYAYNMLSRLKSDCDYVINNNIHMPHNFFWAGNAEDQIKEMRKRWNAFADDEKPEWLTMEQIDEYERKLKEIEK